MKRIGLLTLALVLALGSLGLAYAAWTDEITIQGTVDTGSVNLDVEKYSGTWVWKVPDLTDEIFVWYAEYESWPTEWPYPEDEAIACAFMRPATDNDPDDVEVVGEAMNIFPGVEFIADVVLHYNGSIPAIVQAVPIDLPYDPETMQGNALTAIMGWDHTQSPPVPGAIHDDAALGIMNAAGQYEWEGKDFYQGVQMHDCNKMWIKIVMNVPQDNDLQGLRAMWKVAIRATQWDEWPYDGWDAD